MFCQKIHIHMPRIYNIFRSTLCQPHTFRKRIFVCLFYGSPKLRRILAFFPAFIKWHTYISNATYIGLLIEIIFLNVAHDTNVALAADLFLLPFESLSRISQLTRVKRINFQIHNNESINDKLM